MTKRSLTLGRWAMVAALVVLLTGCLKLDMQLDVQADDTVNGSVVFAVNKDVLALTGGSFSDLIGDQGVPLPGDIEGVTTEEYDDGEFVGQTYTFEGVALSEFNSDPSDPDGLRITHEGDTFVVEGALDLSQGLDGLSGVTGATGPFDPQQMMGSAQLSIAITFPGEVTESNGQVDGNTVTWKPTFGERQELQATASAIASGGGDNWTLVFILIGIAVVAIIAAIVVLMNRRKKAAAAQTLGEPSPMAPPMAETAPMPPAAPEMAETAPSEPPPEMPETAPSEPPPEMAGTAPSEPPPEMPETAPSEPPPPPPPSEPATADTGAAPVEPEEEPPSPGQP